MMTLSLWKIIETIRMRIYVGFLQMFKSTPWFKSKSTLFKVGSHLVLGTLVLSPLTPY
jgi:hypothetical protein